MCKSAAEGGQRCFAETNRRFQAVMRAGRTATAAVMANDNPQTREAFDASQRAIDDAAAQLGSTETGRQVLTRMAEAAATEYPMYAGLMSARWRAAITAGERIAERNAVTAAAIRQGTADPTLSDEDFPIYYGVRDRGEPDWDPTDDPDYVYEIDFEPEEG